MKKIYKKPVIKAAVLKTEEITISPQLSSFNIQQSEATAKSWTTISY